MMRSVQVMLTVRRNWSGAVLLGWLALGCGSEAVSPYRPATEGGAAQLYWALRLDHHAVTLSTVAPYDTLQLAATPLDARGGVLSGLGPVTFISTDPERLQVSPEGLMRAVEGATGVAVIAQLAAGNARHADTVIVNITEESSPQLPETFSIHPDTPSEATWALGGDGTGLFISADGAAFSFSFKLLAARWTDTGGSPISGLALSVTSSDTIVATTAPFGDQVAVLARAPGRVTLIASATAYGVTKADTLPFTITAPVYAVAKITSQPTALGGGTRIAFVASQLTIRRGGTVMWANLTGQPVDVVFDNPANVLEHDAMQCVGAAGGDVGGEGDISLFGEPRDPNDQSLSPANCRSRRFPVAGIYPYHSTLTGATGQITVAEDPEAP